MALRRRTPIRFRKNDERAPTPAPPTAEQRPYSYERHGVTIEDPWHWLRDPKYPEVDDPDVLAYLKAENAYFEGWKSAAPGADRPAVRGDEGADQGRRQLGPDPRRRLALLVGVQARRAISDLVPQAGRAAAATRSSSTSRPKPRASEYFRLGALEVSPDGKLLATLADYDGSERFELRIRDLATGKDIETVTEVGIGQPVWTSDSAGIVFTEVNDNWRSYRAHYHRLGSRGRGRVTLYEETEELGFSVGVGKSQDHSMIFVSTGDNATSEVRFVSGRRPGAAADADLPRASPTANIMSTRRTGNCGSTPTTTM